MSRFANFRSNVRGKLNSALGIDDHTSIEEGTHEISAEELAKEEEDSRKHEYRLVFILEKVREMYKQKGLVGSVEISRSFLCSSNSIGCDIDGSSADDTSTDESSFSEADKAPLLAKVTINNVSRLLKRLETRARNYQYKSYKEDLTISGSIDITDPMGFTGIGISCSATISSLLAGK